MKNSGITRKIDELGRIVVPKEIRYNLGIRDGEPLEIYTDNNSIIIKKYSQIENIKDISQEYCDIFSDTLNIEVMISDREKIIATSNTLNHLINTELCSNHKFLIDNRENYVSNSVESMYNILNYFVIIPIITSTDCCGLVFIVTNDDKDYYQKVGKLMQKLIVKKIDIGA